MYIINKTKNRIEKISEKSFAELGFTERYHLQEWLANNPEALGEDLLIIQKEFDGFNDTRERLDLLALDKFGNLVVIENKLDDSGRDVTWQVLKYASYCSSLKKSEIIIIFQKYLNSKNTGLSADKQLIEFFQVSDISEVELNIGSSQRIVIVAAKFRKEVTSTVMWLRNYKLKIQCFKITPYKMGDQFILDFEQIIPLKDAEEYIIKMEEKQNEEISNQDEIKERHLLRIEFWKRLLKVMNEKSSMFQNINPTKNNYVGTGIGIGGFGFNFVISKDYARCEIYFYRSNKEINKLAFDYLFEIREKIESGFGAPLEWERLDDKIACRIKYEDKSYNVFEKECWNEMIAFMVDGMIRLEQTFKSPLKELQNRLKTSE